MGLAQSHSSQIVSPGSARHNFHNSDHTIQRNQNDTHSQAMHKGGHSNQKDEDEQHFLSWWRRLLLLLTRRKHENWKIQSGPKERRLSFQTVSTLPRTESTDSSTPSYIFVTHPDSSHSNESSCTESTVSDCTGGFNKSETPNHVPINGASDTQNREPSKRSRSPALPCLRPSKKKGLYASNEIDFEEEEISIAQAEIMYSRATWRMYERITTFRAAAAMAEQQKTQRFSMPAATPNPAVGKITPPPFDGNENSYAQQEIYRLYNDEANNLQGTPDEIDSRLMSNFSIDRHNICFEMDHD